MSINRQFNLRAKPRLQNMTKNKNLNCIFKLNIHEKKRESFCIADGLWLRGVPSFAQVQQIISVQSPQKGTKVDIALFSKKEIRYRMSKNGKEILGWSALGLQIDSKETASEVNITGTSKSSHRENMINLLGENRVINNNYNECSINLTSQDYSSSILFRVFDGSLAIRYLIPQQKKKRNNHFKGKHWFQSQWPIPDLSVSPGICIQTVTS